MLTDLSSSNQIPDEPLLGIEVPCLNVSCSSEQSAVSPHAKPSTQMMLCHCTQGSKQPQLLHRFVHPKLAVIAQTTTEDLAERMQQALEARIKVVNAKPTEVKELPKPVAPKASDAQQVSEEHMKRPMTMLD